MNDSWETLWAECPVGCEQYIEVMPYLGGTSAIFCQNCYAHTVIRFV
jgi:hypothetical protein